jgi:hypothetical protein
MAASEFQKYAKTLLEKHYEDVRLEWPVYKDATDSMERDKKQYYPRTDIVVGPFSLAPGQNSRIDITAINKKLMDRLHRDNLTINNNPRCLLAIEVVFSGSSKHLLGDILNASVIGLYGIVVGHPNMITKIKRNKKYLEKLAELGKIDCLPFRNVLIVSTDEFIELLK